MILGSLVVFRQLATPLLPVQLLWINLMTDTVSALVLGIDNRTLVSGASLNRRRVRHSLWAARITLGARAAHSDRWGPQLRRTRGAHNSICSMPACGEASGCERRSSPGLCSPLQSSAATIRSQIVAMLVCVHLMLAYVVRAERFAFERGWWRNAFLLGTTAVGIAVQALVFVLPATRRMLELDVLPASSVLRVAVAVAVFVTLSASWTPARSF